MSQLPQVDEKQAPLGLEFDASSEVWLVADAEGWWWSVSQSNEDEWFLGCGMTAEDTMAGYWAWIGHSVGQTLNGPRPVRYSLEKALYESDCDENLGLMFIDPNGNEIGRRYVK